MEEDNNVNPGTYKRLESPQNGVAGLRHWRQDIFAGFIVSLVSVPLSLGIALASGAPPICGLTSEIIAGLIFPFLGGSYVCIAGPAAGLAPVLYSSIVALGQGNMEHGYRMVLGVIMFAGIIQLILTRLQAAKYSYLIPRAAVQGMLAAIGFLIFAKQIPNFMGVKFHAHEFFDLIAETPTHLGQINTGVLITACTCTALLFVLPKLNKVRWLQMIPPHLVTVLVGIGLAQVFNLSGSNLVHIPENPLQHGIVMPDLTALFSDFKLVPTIIVSVLALTFVDGTESLATIHAVDQIDPYHRKSNPHKTLFAMGISNICSSLIGGLTIIPGIIKSTTCITAGGRTLWVNFYNALFMTALVLFAHDSIRLIPIAALAAVLMHIAYKLAGPAQWKRISDLGTGQLLIFSTTILFTVSYDLLIGIAVGILVKVLILLYYSLKSQGIMNGKVNGVRMCGQCLRQLFSNPVDHVEQNGKGSCIYFAGPLTCFNILSTRSAIEKLIADNKDVRIVLTPQVRIIDHSTSAYFKQVSQDAQKRGTGSVLIEGLDTLNPCSKHSDSIRYRVQCSN